ncbi:hypothetical protein QNH98_04130 [Myroides sp. mNGS23_01]|nr:hypothetical protein [Myroides sp. mNGS23_01]WHT39866.1 hypothetical protein QNH98_04130 [Myroides sp. mNGS23_01]
MIQRLGITILVFLVSVCLYAQEFVVLKGKVVDSNNKKGIPNIMITVYHGKHVDEHAVLGMAITDEKGKFHLEFPQVEEVYVDLPSSLQCQQGKQIDFTNKKVSSVVFDCITPSTEGSEKTIQVLKEEAKEQKQVLDNITIVTPKGGFERDLSSVNLSDITPAVATSNRLETVLTTLSGVNSNNELSSQYTVRGGVLMRI